MLFMMGIIPVEQKRTIPDDPHYQGQWTAVKFPHKASFFILGCWRSQKSW